MTEPLQMPPVPVPDEFSLAHTFDFALCFIGGRLVQHRHTVVMELFRDGQPLPAEAPARLILATTSVRPGYMLKELVPSEWRTPPYLPVEDERYSLARLARRAFDDMERRHFRMWYFLPRMGGITAALVSAPRNDSGLVAMRRFNRRTERPMVAGISILHRERPSAGPASAGTDG